MRSLRKIPKRLRGTNFCTSLERFTPSLARKPSGPKWHKTNQNMSLGTNGVDWVCSSRKTLMRLRGTNFCTSSARITPSIVRQPNGPECTQIVRNAPKRQFRLQWGGLGAFVAKSSTRLRGMNFCTSSACFAPSFVRQPDGHELTQVV